MTLQQIQRKVKALPHAEQLALSAFLRHLSRVDQPANRTSLDEAAARMEAGEKVPRAQLRRLHHSLKAASV